LPPLLRSCEQVQPWRMASGEPGSSARARRPPPGFLSRAACRKYPQEGLPYQIQAHGDGGVPQFDQRAMKNVKLQNRPPRNEQAGTEAGAYLAATSPSNGLMRFFTLRLRPTSMACWRY
jgi:hypothetical protein